MNDNKSNIVKGLKILGLAIWGLLIIATCAGVLNYCPEKAVKVFATILGVWNCALLGYAAKRAFKDEDE